MKPHPRIRKMVKWGGAVVTVLLVVVWIGSGAYQMAWTSSRGYWIDMKLGGVDYYCNPPIINDMHAPRWQLTRVSFLISMRPSWHSSPWETSVFLPLWLPAITALIATIAAWHLDTLARRRARLNLCPKCNYDRAGLAAGAVCPECGTASSASSCT